MKPTLALFYLIFSLSIIETSYSNDWIIKAKVSNVDFQSLHYLQFKEGQLEFGMNNNFICPWKDSARIGSFRIEKKEAFKNIIKKMNILSEKYKNRKKLQRVITLENNHNIYYNLNDHEIERTSALGSAIKAALLMTCRVREETFYTGTQLKTGKTSLDINMYMKGKRISHSRKSYFDYNCRVIGKNKKRDLHQCQDDKNQRFNISYLRKL